MWTLWQLTELNPCKALFCRCATSAVVSALFTAALAHAQTSNQQASQTRLAEKVASTAKPSIVAWVDSTPIYYREVERGVAAASRGKTVDADKLPLLQAAVLQELIDQLILSKFLQRPELQPTAAEIDAALDDFSKKLQEQNQSLKGYLEQYKIPESAVRKKLAQDLALQKYTSQNITDDDLQKYFHEFRSEFDGSQRRASHILFRPAGLIDEDMLRRLTFQAQQLRGRIVTGEITFEDAAEQYSDGPSRLHGGDLGFIPRQGLASDQFSATLFSLKPGDVSQPVLDSFGMHLIKATAQKPGQTTWQEVREPLKTAYSRTVVSNLINDLHSKAKVEFFESFPHYLPGTHDLAPPQPVGTTP